MNRLPLIVAFALVSVIAWAQLPTATLNGTVIDPNGALVTGAKVTVTNPSTNDTRQTFTGNDGRYTVPNLPAGSYNVRVEAKGFSTREYKNVYLEVGRAVTLDAPLSVAKVGEVVVVQGGASAIELTQSQVQGQITAETVASIPLNGRNFLELAYLLPGNRPATNYDPTKTNTLEVSSAGAFGRGGNITVDGADNNDEVVGGTLANFPQDGIQEFQIVTNRFTAEVGRSGSSIINIVSKSGTNNIHGGGFFFFRHKTLQALPATFSQGLSKPPFDREQYGGFLGGPLIKEKAFWFVSLENRRQRAVVDVGQRDFATNTILGTSAAAPLDDFMFSTHENIRPTENNLIGFRYSYNKSDDTANGSLRQPQGTAANRQSSKNRFNSVMANWSHIFSPSFYNDLLFHYDRFLNEIPAFPENNALTNPVGLAAGNEIRFPTLQDGANFRIPQRTRFDRYEIKEGIFWSKGKHTFHFGGEFQNIGSDILFDLFGSGTILTTENFGGDICRAANPPVPELPNCDRNSDGVVDDRDIPIAVALRSAAPVRPPAVPFIRNSYWGFFAQDDWKPFSNLTVNLGLRYDYDNNILGNGAFHEPCPEPLTTQPSERCVWIRTLLGKHDNGSANHNFGPRIGFAWDPFKKGTTVVRGGYGIYYDRVVMEVPLLELLLDGRILPLQSTDGSTLDAAGKFAPDPVTGQIVNLENPFGGKVTTFGAGINLIDRHAAQPRVQQATVGFQQEIARNWVVSADALHNYGDRLLIGRFLRGVTGVPDISCTGELPCDVTDPLTGIGAQNVTLIQSAAKSWYDGLLVSLQRKVTGSKDWKWGFNMNYTLSKSFNYANDDQIPFNGAEDAVNVKFKTNDLELEKGYSPTDERHRWVFYGQFDVPYQISIAPIWTVSSSVPMDSLVPLLSSRLPTIRRNALGREITNGAQLLAAIDAYNALPDCLTAPPGPCNFVQVAHPGITPNMHFGDHFNSLDLRVTKNFKLTERQNLQFISEVFNLWNATNIRGKNNNNYSGFSNDITSSSFNTPITTAGGFFGSGGPRAFQFAVKYSF